MIEYSRHQLDNGLTVLIHQDNQTPLVTINLLYKVGSRNETTGKTGLAHFLEHLMFTGSENFPDFDGVLQQFGGQNNAFTNTDVTNYYMTIPKQCLELGLAIEADRMQALSFNYDAFKVQQGVVVEEFKQRYSNPPFGDAWHKLREMVYPSDPYCWPTIGRTTEEIDQFVIEDAKSFYQKFYHPGNAILSVGGPVDVLETLELIRVKFGHIVNHDAVDRLPFNGNVQIKEQLELCRRKVPHEALYMAWPLSSRMDDSYYTGELLSDILTSGFSSRLFLDAVQRLGLFERVESFVLGQNENAMFVVYGVPASEGQDPTTLTKAIHELLQTYAREGFTTNELLKVQRKSMSALAFGELEVPNKAMNLCLMEGLGGADLVNEESDRYNRVGLEDLQKLIEVYLLPENCSSLLYQKEQNA